MERFVLLRIFNKTKDEEVERWFNLRVIRQFDTSKNEVMLQGSANPIRVTTGSMTNLVDMVMSLNRITEYNEEEAYHSGAIVREFHKEINIASRKKGFFQRIKEKIWRR